jgi:hypothetical protein
MTEHQICELITKQTCDRFCPQSAEWIVCQNYTYSPHSNECGPRMLITMSVMMTQPSPNKVILLPYMHPTIAQIARMFVAATLLTGKIITFPLCIIPHQLTVLAVPSSQVHLPP